VHNFAVSGIRLNSSVVVCCLAVAKMSHRQSVCRQDGVAQMASPKCPIPICNTPAFYMDRRLVWNEDFCDPINTVLDGGTESKSAMGGGSDSMQPSPNYFGQLFAQLCCFIVFCIQEFFRPECYSKCYVPKVV